MVDTTKNNNASKSSIKPILVSLAVVFIGSFVGYASNSLTNFFASTSTSLINMQNSINRLEEELQSTQELLRDTTASTQRLNAQTLDKTVLDERFNNLYKNVDDSYNQTDLKIDDIHKILLQHSEKIGMLQGRVKPNFEDY